jgi:type IV pilus assembly protein PilV
VNRLCCSNATTGGGASGFTLIEVLVALLVTASGLLGLAKMQALAIASTKESGTRGLIALQTSSLAASMHANPGFWATGLAPASFSASGTVVVDASATLTSGAAGGCTSACTPTELAAVDVKNWVVDMNNQFPSYTAKVVCTTAVPVECGIAVTWSEKIVAMNQTTATGAATQVATQSFLEYVKP